MEDEQAEINAFLSRPEAYGLLGAVIERRATHGSIVFLAGADAYKLKRAVRYSYMDFSTVERRKAMCEAELAVNRCLAPELYLDVLPVIRDKRGALRIGKTGESEGAVDWLVHMRRFADGTLLETIQRGGEFSLLLARNLAERIAEFHRTAAAQPAFGGARGIACVIDENSETLSRMAGAPFDRAKVDRLETLARASLEQLQALLDSRRDDGHVRRCHGDMHLNNVCMLDGRAVLFDAIEFNEDFASIDVLYDLAFLLMDLDRRGLRAHANVILNRYLEKTLDYAGLAALPLFLSCRAAVRAHVTITAAALERGGISGAHARDAADLLDDAIAYLEPQLSLMVAVGGVSGTGKSILSAALAPRFGRAPGAIVVRTDVIRKQLWGVDELSRLPDAAYDPKFTHRVYALAEQRARLILAGGASVILDAVCGRAKEQAAIEDVARETGATFRGLWLEAPVSTLEQRIAARRNDASDATVAVLHAQLGHVEVPAKWTRVDASGSTADIFEKAMRASETGA